MMTSSPLDPGAWSSGFVWDLEFGSWTLGTLLSLLPEKPRQNPGDLIQCKRPKSLSNGNVQRSPLMKTNRILLGALLETILSLGGATQLLAQGTAFTYQGRLNDGAAPANGSYDLT